MHRGFGRIALVALLAFGAFATATLGAGTAIAFDQPWFPAGCQNVPAGRSALWDDAPAGEELDNEAGFVWLASDQPANESCRWVSPNVGVQTMNTSLTLDAAVNDDAILRVQAKQGSNMCAGGVVLGEVVIGGPPLQDDRSNYVTKTVMLPNGMMVNEVCLLLTDDPDASVDPRTTALIDDIKVGPWEESFTGGGD